MDQGVQQASRKMQQVQISMPARMWERVKDLAEAESEREEMVISAAEWVREAVRQRLARIEAGEG